MTAANPIPISEYSTHRSGSLKIPNHQWGKPRKGKIKCKVCKLEINKEDKIFNNYCRVKHDWQKVKPTHHKLTCVNCGGRAWQHEIDILEKKHSDSKFCPEFLLERRRREAEDE